MQAGEAEDAAGDAAQWNRLRRSFLTLLAMRWFQTGLQLPVLVLLLRARGLSVAEVGAIAAVFAGSIAVFELPTGGLADAVGRRPVLIAAAMLFVAQNVMFGLGQRIGVFVVAAAIGGLGRALDSGPLEAWFVDRAYERGTAVDLSRELSRARAIESVAAGVGVLAAGGLVSALPFDGDGMVIALSGPFLVSAVVCLAMLIATVAWVSEPAHRSGTTLRHAAIEVPRTIGVGVRLAAGPGPLRRMTVLMATLGVSLAGVELLAPISLADLLDSQNRAASLYAVLVTVGLFGSALGSMQAPVFESRLRSAASAILLARLLGAGAVLALIAPSVGVFGVAVASFYALNGLARPLVGRIIHASVDASERATVLSVQSLTLQLSGVVASLAFGRIADHHSVALALAIAAVTLAAGATACVAMPAVRSPGQSIDFHEQTAGVPDTRR